MWRAKSISAVHPKLDNPQLEDKKKKKTASSVSGGLSRWKQKAMRDLRVEVTGLGLGGSMDRRRVRGWRMQNIYKSSINVCVCVRERESMVERDGNMYLGGNY